MKEAAATTMDLSHHFLIAMPAMADPNFEGAVVYLAEHNSKGALGLVVNRTLDMDLKTLFEKIDLKADASVPGAEPVHFGGPVQTDRGFVLHQPSGVWSSTMKMDDELGLTSSKDILEAAALGQGPAKMLVMLGYAGWGPGQLEKELAENAWLTVKADPALLFEVPVKERFHKAFELLGVDPLMLSGAAGHA